MTLRFITALIVAATVLGTGASVFTFSKFVTDRSFSNLEDSFAERDLERARNAIHAQVAELDATALDWASWDATYTYAANGNASYEAENLTQQTLSTLSLNFLVLARLDGTVIAERGLDRTSGDPIAVPTNLIGAVLLEPGLSPESAASHNESGLRVLGDVPLLFALRPILTSQATGPARGYLIMARYLDAETVGQLADQTVLNLSAVVAGGPPSASLSSRTGPDDTLIASGDLSTGEQDRHVTVNVSIDTEIARAGTRVGRWMLFISVGVALGSGIIIFLLLQRLVVRRLHRLSTELAGVARAGVQGRRVTMQGRDEISELAGDINTTLAALEEAMGRYETLVESAADAIYVVEDGHIVFANPAAHQLGGEPGGEAGSELAGSPATVIVSAAGRDGLLRALGANESAAPLRMEADSADSTRRLDLAFVPVARQPGVTQIIARDITELRSQEEARREFNRNVLESQRLESLGLFAGGIAHDFNNILTAIVGNAALARIDEDRTEAIEAIESAAYHAADLTRQLLAYAGGGQLQVRRVAIGPLVDETVRLVRRVAKSVVEVDVRPPAGAAFVDGDEVQLRQVVMNLVSNAYDALAESAGRIVVSNGAREFGRKELANVLVGTVTPGWYAFIRVADDGPGIAPEQSARIFEPFVSSKGQGRGLGLAAVAGIVRGHNGAIVVESSAGKGTSVAVILPLAAAAHASDEDHPAEAASAE